MKKRLAAWGLAVLLAFSLTACGGLKQSTQPPASKPGDAGQTEPGKQDPGKQDPGKQDPGKQDPGTAPEVKEIKESEAPQALRDWVASEKMNTSPAYKVLTENGVTYIAATGGLQNTGGWMASLQRSALTPSIGEAGGRLELEITFTPPAGMATMAMTNPVGYWKAVPAFSGEVKVEIAIATAKPAASDLPRTFFVEQADGMGWWIFRATGDLKSPRVEYRKGDQILASKDLQPNPAEGGFRGSMPQPQERTEQVEIVLLSDGQVIARAPVWQTLGVSQRWSANFLVDPPRKIDATTIALKGKARAFEAVFIVEVRKEGRLLVSQPVMAKEGAPAYGDFEATVKVPGGVPDGAEVWVARENMNDGSTIVELMIPVVDNLK